MINGRKEMCGILGVVKLSPTANIDRLALDALLNALSHRGPDAQGVHHDFAFSFLHTRLSIVDLNPLANQPMTDEQGLVYLTYNGEIYNYREIRSDLIRAGKKFRTQSDTEVILEAYKCWGISCIEK